MARRILKVPKYFPPHPQVHWLEPLKDDTMLCGIKASEGIVYDGHGYLVGCPTCKTHFLSLPIPRRLSILKHHGLNIEDNLPKRLSTLTSPVACSDCNYLTNAPCLQYCTPGQERMQILNGTPKTSNVPFNPPHKGPK